MVLIATLSAADLPGQELRSKIAVVVAWASFVAGFAESAVSHSFYGIRSRMIRSTGIEIETMIKPQFRK
jgi:hypothetical protein